MDITDVDLVCILFHSVCTYSNHHSLPIPSPVQNPLLLLSNLRNSLSSSHFRSSFSPTTSSSTILEESIHFGELGFRNVLSDVGVCGTLSERLLSKPVIDCLILDALPDSSVSVSVLRFSSRLFRDFLHFPALSSFWTSFSPGSIASSNFFVGVSNGDWIVSILRTGYSGIDNALIARLVAGSNESTSSNIVRMFKSQGAGCFMCAGDSVGTTGSWEEC